MYLAINYKFLIKSTSNKKHFKILKNYISFYPGNLLTNKFLEIQTTYQYSTSDSALLVYSETLLSKIYQFHISL